MSELSIKSVSPASLAKIVGVYSLFMALIAVILDLLILLVTGNSTFVGTSGWISWIFYTIAFVILAPIVAFVFGLIVGFVLNLALKTTDGFTIEVK